MFVPSMSIPEAIAEAKADLPNVQNKMLGLIKEQERRHRKNRRNGDLRTTMDYISRRKNNWLYVLTTNKKHSFQNFLMWFHADNGLHGLQLCSEGLHYLYTPHFFTRFRERSGQGLPGAIENLTNFYYRNSNATIMRTGKEHLGHPGIIGAIPDGYILGTTHEAEGYQRCRTFVSHEQAFPNQKEDWEGLAALHELRARYPALFRQIKSTP